MFASADTSVSSRFSVESSSHSGRFCKLCPAAPLRQFPGAPSLRREPAGFNDLDESSGGDVEEELVLELDDRPGNTTSTKFSFSH